MEDKHKAEYFRCLNEFEALLKAKNLIFAENSGLESLANKYINPKPGSDDINVLALVKGEERFVFLYDDASRAETLRTLGRFASNPELTFT